MTAPAPPALPDGHVLADARPISGGSICDVWHGWLENGRRVVVKRTPYSPAVEADGLGALAEAGAPVPAVVAIGDDLLVLEHVDGPADWSALGRALAGLHRCTGETFGWHLDNLIGRLPQRNDVSYDWPVFYAEQRIRPHLDAPALPADVRERLEQALDGALQRLLDHDALPSLVHGDLWSGNVVDGRWLIDPAVHRADREFELAFMDLFGGLPSALWDAYLTAWPLDDGWQRRRPALQLYHLLVHVGHFGAAYVPGVTQRLEQLGW